MEPIRPNESRNLDRRRRRTVHHDSGAVGGFAERLEASAVETELGEDDAVVGAPLGTAVGGSVEQLLDRVHSVGERLLAERGFSAVQEYREAVRRFLGAVLPDASAVEVHESNRDILSRKRYYLLGRINRSVERLVTGLLQSQMEQIEILTKLEEIEGMLVDLLH